MNDKNWLLLDLGEGWQTILPDLDINPHAKIILNFPDGEKEATLADFDCPCRPQIDFKNKLIIHNAFDKREDEENKKERTEFPHI